MLSFHGQKLRILKILKKNLEKPVNPEKSGKNPLTG